MNPHRSNLSPVAGDNWQATRVEVLPTQIATQILRDEKDDPAVTGREIGRRVGNDQRELFVSCGPAEAMRQQFEIVRPEFIALHDLGTALSRKLISGLASASGRRVQRLVIRRQGYGTPLATLEFIEWGTAEGRTLRLYTTEIDADSASRGALALTLLAHSQLGVVIVGDLPAHALASALQPLQQAMQGSSWPNRHLLLLPLTSASALASQGAQLARQTGANVRTTPQVGKPADAWTFITGTWNQMHDQPALRGMQLPALAETTPATPPAEGATAPAPRHAATATASAASAHPMVTEPLPLKPMPELPHAGAPAPRIEDALGHYVERVAKLNGLRACCVFDIGEGKSLAYAGARFEAAQLARQGRGLLEAAAASGKALGMTAASTEIALSLDACHVVLRPLPRHPRLMLIGVLDKNVANLTLARLQIQRLDEDFSA